MADPKLSFEDFVRVSTATALKAVHAEVSAGRFKVPPKIWVGIWIDPTEIKLPAGGTGGPG